MSCYFSCFALGAVCPEKSYLVSVLERSSFASWASVAAVTQYCSFSIEVWGCRPQLGSCIQSNFLSFSPSTLDLGLAFAILNLPSQALSVCFCSWSWFEARIRGYYKQLNRS